MHPIALKSFDGKTVYQTHVPELKPVIIWQLRAFVRTGAVYHEVESLIIPALRYENREVAQLRRSKESLDSG